MSDERDEQQPTLCRRILIKLFKRTAMVLILLSFSLALWTRHIRLAQPSERVYTAGERPPIFSTDAVNVIDVRNGSVETLYSLAWRHDSVAAMLYAPWSGQSRKVAPWFQEAALEMRNEALFVAVDCWYPHGSCRQDFSLPNYPRLFVYFARKLRFLEYIGGLRSYEITRFVKLVVRPLFFVSTEVVYNSFVTSEETVVLGFFDFKLDPEPREYLAYLGAARMALADDVGDGLRFGVISSINVALIAEMPDPPSVMLCRATHSNMIFDGEWTPETIYNWAFKQREQHVSLLVNSLNLVDKIRRQPALILFLPLNDSSIADKLLRMLRRLAGAFYTCSFAHHPPACHDKNSNLWSSRVDLWDVLDDGATEYSQCSLRHYYYSMRRLTNYQSAKFLVDNNDLHSSPSPKDDSDKVWYELGKGREADCETSVSVSLSDHLASDIETPSSDITETDLDDVSYANKITGLGCSGSSVQNLSFFYMDSVKHWVYATALAVDGLLQPRVAVTITDTKNRSQFVYHENQLITEEATAEFIWKFLHSQLERRLKSAPVPTSSCVPSHLSGCVWEVVRDTFDQVVLDNTKDVLLVHYSPSCAFCKTLVPVILRLAHALESNNHIRIARINRIDNELPHAHDAFKPLVYPSFVLYPANRKNEPILYPRDFALTIDHLVSFLKRHGSRPLTATVRSHHKAVFKLYSLRHEHQKTVEKGKGLQTLVDFLKSENRVLLDRAVNRAIRLRWYRQRMKDLLSDIDALVSESTCSMASVFPAQTKASVKVKQLERQMRTIETTISNTALFKEMLDQQVRLLQVEGTVSFLTYQNEKLAEKLQRMTAMFWSAKDRLNVLSTRCRHLTSELVRSRSLSFHAVSRYNALARRMQGTVGSVLQSARAIQDDMHRLTEGERTQSVLYSEEEPLRPGREEGEEEALVSVMKRDSSDSMEPVSTNEVDRKGTD